MRPTIAAAQHVSAENRARFPDPCHGANVINLFRDGTLKTEICRPNKIDLQRPHDKDQVCFIAGGSGTSEHKGEREALTPRGAIFAHTGDHHRFVDFSHDFAAWVVCDGPRGREA